MQSQVRLSFCRDFLKLQYLIFLTNVMELQTKQEVEMKRQHYFPLKGVYFCPLSFGIDLNKLTLHAFVARLYLFRKSAALNATGTSTNIVHLANGCRKK